MEDSFDKYLVYKDSLHKRMYSLFRMEILIIYQDLVHFGIFIPSVLLHWWSFLERTMLSNHAMQVYLTFCKAYFIYVNRFVCASQFTSIFLC